MTMIMKEAFRYQNYLDELWGAADSYLRSTNNVMKVEETHLCSKSHAGAEDVVKNNLADRELPVSPDVVVNFMLAVLNEKAAVAKAINTAKMQHCPEMDMEIGLNRMRQKMERSFQRLAALKNRTATTRGTGYCFNAEGNQVAYSYDVEVKSTIDFDRAKVKQNLSAIADESTRVSNAIDYWSSSVPVDICPMFSINDTFEEIVESMAI